MILTYGVFATLFLFLALIVCLLEQDISKRLTLLICLAALLWPISVPVLIVCCIHDAWIRKEW